MRSNGVQGLCVVPTKIRTKHTNSGGGSGGEGRIRVPRTRKSWGLHRLIRTTAVVRWPSVEGGRSGRRSRQFVGCARVSGVRAHDILYYIYTWVMWTRRPLGRSRLLLLLLFATTTAATIATVEEQSRPTTWLVGHSGTMVGGRPGVDSRDVTVVRPGGGSLLRAWTAWSFVSSHDLHLRSTSYRTQQYVPIQYYITIIILYSHWLV